MEIQDLSFQRVGRCVPAGSHLYHGRMVQDSKFEELYVTKTKEYTKEEWIQTALQVVHENKLDDLYEKVRNYCKENCYFLKTEEDLTERALSCMTTEAYKSWETF